MNVAIWDTYVTKKDGTVMHFDIILPQEIKNEETVFKFGKEYLKGKGQEEQALTSKQCQFCHIEIIKPHWEEAIIQNGYYIYEMENCN